MDSVETLDRIREIAMTVSEPKNAGEIADVVGVARNTAAKYLAQLAEDDVLIAETRGRETVYRPDPVTQYFDQLRELTSDHTKEELTHTSWMPSERTSSGSNLSTVSDAPTSFALPSATRPTVTNGHSAVGTPRTGSTSNTSVVSFSKH